MTSSGSVSVTRFKHNLAGYRELLKSGGVEAMLVGKMTPALAVMKATTPVKSGDAADSLQMVVDQHPQRVAVHIISSSPYWFRIEADHGTMARGLDAAG